MTILKNIVLAPYRSFFIGGPAKYFCEVTTNQDLTEAIAFAQQNNLQTFFSPFFPPKVNNEVNECIIKSPTSFSTKRRMIIAPLPLFV